MTRANRHPGSVVGARSSGGDAACNDNRDKVNGLKSGIISPAIVNSGDSAFAGVAGANKDLTACRISSSRIGRSVAVSSEPESEVSSNFGVADARKIEGWSVR